MRLTSVGRTIDMGEIILIKEYTVKKVMPNGTIVYTDGDKVTGWVYQKKTPVYGDKIYLDESGRAVEKPKPQPKPIVVPRRKKNTSLKNAESENDEADKS